ncbi:MAG: glycosyltransferase family 4 protein [Alphaproteobacteria bacterium]
MPKILFVVTEDWYFCSHRLALAVAARGQGYDVVVATRVLDHGAQIREAGLSLEPLNWQRRSLNPIAGIAALGCLVRLYRHLRPDLVHHVALKPVILGSMAAALAGRPRTVNALAGLGFVFASASSRARLLRPVVRRLLAILLGRGGARVIVQNPDDREFLVTRHMVAADRIHLIRGAGVDLQEFQPRPEPEGAVTVALVSRMLWDKGVGVLVEAARIVRRRGTNVTVTLAGIPDAASPNAVPEAQLRAWNHEGIVDWIGFCDDVPALWARTHVAALPSSYGEGVPKSLIEAAAAGRPIIAADGPGLREIVRHGETGLLVPPGDAEALADAIEQLAGDADLRRRMGAAGRKLAEAEFGADLVIGETLALYRELLGTPWPDG